MLKGKCVWAGALAIIATAIFGASSYAESANTDFNIKVNPSLSLSVSSSNVGFSLTPTQAGSYDSVSFNVYSSTNNIAGYTLMMSTNKVDLESSVVNPNTGTNPTIPTLTETQNGITAAAFEASTSADVLNHWGISVAGANYNAMKSTQEIKKTTVNNTTEDTTAISLASKLNLLTVPGVYSTTINFQLVANVYTKGGSINENGRYPANSLLRAFEIAYTEAGKPMYIEDANTDIGWRPMVGSDYDAINDREVRFAMQDITMTFEENGQTKNVCEWAQASAADNSYIDIAEVMDLRDGTSYHIVKAADNRCWLADNLALNIVDGDIKNRLSPSNTNADSAAIDALKNGGRANGSGYATSGVIEWTTSNIYSYSVPYVSTASINVVSSDSMDQAGSWKVGAYYNYCATSAGSYCYGDGQRATLENSHPINRPGTEVDAEFDICPAGWRMPTGGSGTSELTLLYNAYPPYSDVSRLVNVRGSIHISLSGQFQYTAGGVGTLGRFWTSTITNSEPSMHILNTEPQNGGVLDIYSSHERQMALPVRCIAK